ncbi:MAG: hypothetical protein P1U86_13040 [Verrucomicrobiales bacterium]|nr:hypothetical protein [Verrucomicrobiales bacterium]
MKKPNCLFITPPLSTLPGNRRNSVLKRMRALQADYWVYVAEPERTTVEDDESGVRFLALHDSITSRFGELLLAVAYDEDLYQSYLKQVDDGTRKVCLANIPEEAEIAAFRR